MCSTAPPEALDPSPKSKLSPGTDMRSTAAAAMLTGTPEKPDPGTFAAVMTGGTGSNAETCAVDSPFTVRCQTANALPWSSSAMSGESSRPPGDVTATGSTSPNSVPSRRRAEKIASLPFDVPTYAASMSPLGDAPTASPRRVVAPDNGLGEENAAAPRNADTICPPASHVEPALPASSSASVGSLDSTARFESFVNGVQVPVANGALRSANATYAGATPSR